MKKTLSVIILLFVLINCFSLSCKALGVSAVSAVLIDAENGRVLYSKNMTQIMTMASTTKIMTGLLAVENGNLEDIVTVSKNAAYQEGSSMYLKAGEKVKLSELIYGLMLSSGNDAAVAIAEHISGSVEKFSALMTQRAKDIGAAQTTFKNPNGLDEQGHQTTALDMAKITAHAIKNEQFAKIFGTYSITMDRGTYTNHNKLLKSCEGVCGGKTGFTKKSGRCLVSVCERDGFKVIAVTLNAPDDWNDHKNMFDFAYESFTRVTPVTKGNKFGEIVAENGEKVEVIADNSISLHLSAEEQKKLEIVNDLPATLSLPVKRGQQVGKVTAIVNGVKMGESAILANRDILPPKKDNLYDFFIKTCEIWFKAFI